MKKPLPLLAGLLGLVFLALAATGSRLPAASPPSYRGFKLVQRMFTPGTRLAR